MGRERDSYMLRSKAQERDSDSELEAAAAKRKGSRGKIAVRPAHAPCWPALGGSVVWM